jgi:hypothetical protein
MMVWVAIARDCINGGVVAVACADTSDAARAKVVSDVRDNPDLDFEDVLWDRPVEVEVVKEYKHNG